MMARSDPIEEPSLPAMRARSRPGTAKAAMRATGSGRSEAEPHESRVGLAQGFGMNKVS